MSYIQFHDLYPVLVAFQFSTLNRENRGLNLLFRILGNFVHSTLPQLTQLYKTVTGNIQWWLRERIFFFVMNRVFSG